MHSLIRNAKRKYMWKFEQTKGNMKKAWNMINIKKRIIKQNLKRR